MSISSLLLEEKKAMLHVQEAKKKAQEIIRSARAEAERILRESINEEKIRELLKEYEGEVRKEAEKILEEYRAEAEKIKSVPEDLIEKAASLIAEEVLRHGL